MSIYEDTVGLESFLQKGLHISQHLTGCQTENPSIAATSPGNVLPAPELMQTDSYHLSSTERARHSRTVPFCPVRSTCSAVSTVQIHPDVSSIPHIDARLIYLSQSFPVKVLVDSWASGNFISSLCLTQIKLPQHHYATTYRISKIQGKPLGNGLARHRTTEVTLSIGSLHSECILFLVLEETTVDIVLGCPWLAQRHPLGFWGGTRVEFSRDVKLIFPHQVEPTPLFLSAQTPSKDLPPRAQSKFLQYTGCSRTFSARSRQHIFHHIGHGTGVHPSFQFPGCIQFLLCGEEGRGLRPCIDYHTLIAQTVKFAYLLPLVPAALEELHGACIFSKLDLRSAYNWSASEEEMSERWPFITPSGHYKYRVMPYGLSNSPSVFQNFMNEIFRDMLNRFVIIYIDDIINYSLNLEEHQRQVTQVLQRVSQHQFYLILEKCNFHQTTIQFLGYIISPEGVQMDQGKVNAVRNWPQTTTVTELQRILGFAHFYCRFIAHFTILHACAYFSKKMSPEEQNHDIGKCELMAIKLALEE